MVTAEELRAAREKERKDKEWETPEWGAGVAQQRAAAERSAEMRTAASQPFARTRSIPVPHAIRSADKPAFSCPG